VRSAGVSLETTARAVPAVSFGLCVVLVGLFAFGAVQELLPQNPRSILWQRTALVSSALCTIHVPVFWLSTRTLSEMPFMALTVLTLYACTRATRAPAGRATLAWLAIASLAAGLAMLTRYLGVAVWLVLSGIALGLAKQRKLSFACAAAVVALGVAPLGLWFGRNVLLLGRLSGGGGGEPAHSAVENVGLTLQTLIADAVPRPILLSGIGGSLPLSPQALGALLGVVAALLCLWLFRGHLKWISTACLRQSRQSFAARLGLSYSAAYLLTLIVCASTVSSEINRRLVAVVYPIVFCAGVPVCASVLLLCATERQELHRRLRGLVLVYCAASGLAFVATVAGMSHNRGAELSQMRGTDSFRFLSQMTCDRFVSNLPGQLWWLTRKPTKSVPTRNALRRADELPDATGAGSCVVLFRAAESPYRPDLSEIQKAGLPQRFGWRLIRSFDDCSIYMADEITVE